MFQYLRRRLMLTCICLILGLYILFNVPGLNRSPDALVAVARHDDVTPGVHIDDINVDPNRNDDVAHASDDTNGVAWKNAGTSKNEEVIEEVNLPEDGELQLARDLVDLDPEELFNRTVIITGFSQNHFKEAKGMLGSVQKFLPHTKIIAYDLGLRKESIKEVKRMCNVKLRKFDSSKYPSHVAKLLTYAFKPIIIEEALREFDVVFWCDASARFQRDPRVMYPYLKEQHGFMRRIVRYDPKLIITRTNPAMFKELGVDRVKYSKDVDHAPSFEANRLLFINSTLIREKLITPWVDCALRRQCIAPDKSTLKLNHGGPLYTHRYDQAAISILAYKNMYDAWTKDNDRTKLFVSVVDLSRTTIGWQTVQYCPTE
ncbi:uncharacterized protein [Asterias amurensis]|uniref:uncharacterized protein n=1 Tax=Asterias amurensis TaxID=7602 RepID=UPI003AB71EB4